MIDSLQLQASRAILLWGAMTGRLTWHLYNFLMRDVIHHERRVMGCDGKERFHTFEHADRVANRASRDGYKNRKVYHCLICGFFHLATRLPELRRSRQRMKARKAEKEFQKA